MPVIPTSCLSSPRFWDDLVSWCYSSRCPKRFAVGYTNRDILAAYAANSDAYEATLRLPSARRLDPIDVMGKRFRYRCLKKFECLRDDSYESAAVKGFLQRNSLPYLRIPKHYARIQRQVLARVLPMIALQCGRFGPGAVSERFDQAERWEAASGFSFDVRDPDLLYHALQETCVSPAARLCAVPKDWKKDRLITIEPCQNTFLQQATRSTILKSLHLGVPMSSLDQGWVDVPKLQGTFALRGSLDGSLETWDLSNASDSIFEDHVWDVFPAWVCSWLEACRTTLVAWEMDGRAEEAPLRIYAGMGNATTFIVESLLFWSLCVAVAEYHRVGKYHVSVFGDDIILDRRLGALMRELNVFADVGFTVNAEKTMHGSDNPYRESCGVYALNGINVSVPSIRGYSCSEPLDQFSFYGLVNTLATCRFPEGHILAEKLVRMFNMVVSPAKGGLSVQLPWDSGLSGDTTGYRRPSTRWNKQLFRQEYHLKGIQSKCIVRPANRVEYRLYAYSRYTQDESPEPWKFWQPYHLPSSSHVTIVRQQNGKRKLLVQFPTRETLTHNAWYP